MDISGALPQLLPSPRPDDTRLDVLDDGAERREVLDAIDRDELTGNLIGQEAALLDVTAPSGLDDLSTISHGLNRLRGLLLHADGRWRLVSIGSGAETGTPPIIDPAPTPGQLDVQGGSVLGSKSVGHIVDPELDAHPALVLASSLGFAMGEVGTLTDAVTEIDDVLTPRLRVDVEQAGAIPWAITVMASSQARRVRFSIRSSVPLACVGMGSLG